MLNPLEKDIFELIFDIDMGANTKADGKRYLAAKIIAKNHIDFITYNWGISKEDILSAYMAYKVMEDI
jgi:hypothetical protein